MAGFRGWSAALLALLWVAPAWGQFRPVPYPELPVYSYPRATPVYLDPFEPWPYSSRVFGLPWYAGVENPTGHVIRPTGPNGYTYGPVYGPGLDREFPLSKITGAGLATVADVAVAPPLEPAAPRPVDRLMSYAVRDFYLANYQAVIQTLGRLEAEVPGLAGAELLRVPAYLGLGRFDRAAERLVRITEVQPPSAWGIVFEHVNEFYHRPADLAGHLEAAEELVAQGGASPDVYLVLGYAYSYLGQPARGAQYLERSERAAAELGMPRMAAAAARIRRQMQPLPPGPREF